MGRLGIREVLAALARDFDVDECCRLVLENCFNKNSVKLKNTLRFTILTLTLSDQQCNLYVQLCQSLDSSIQRHHEFLGLDYHWLDGNEILDLYSDNCRMMN